MRYYKSKDGEVFGYDDTQDDLADLAIENGAVDITGSWPIPYMPTLADQDLAARNQRSQLLSDTDWSQGRDIPEATATKWAPYRQLLRDVTKQAGFPTSIIWPVSP